MSGIFQAKAIIDDKVKNRECHCSEKGFIQFIDFVKLVLESNYSNLEISVPSLLGEYAEYNWATIVDGAFFREDPDCLKIIENVKELLRKN